MLMRALALLAVVAMLVAAGWALNDAIRGAPRTALNPIVLMEPSPDETKDDDSGPRGQNPPAGHKPGRDPAGRGDPNPNGGSSGGPGGGGASGGAGGAAPAPPPPARPAGDDDDGPSGQATDDGGGDD